MRQAFSLAGLQGACTLPRPTWVLVPREDMRSFITPATRSSRLDPGLQIFGIAASLQDRSTLHPTALCAYPRLMKEIH